tara:strand:- start:7046 stop:9007 length:1962 start_codon:yes stop_codon:yes gene_type:complete
MDNNALKETYKYTDYASGNIANRNNVVDYIEVYSSSMKEPLGTDVYCGMFQFDSSFKEHVEGTGSVSGFKGVHFAWFLTIDIDASHGDIDEAKTKTIQLIQYFEKLGVSSEEIYIYFSGAKGFHISLPHTLFGYAPSSKLNATLKRMAMTISTLSGVNIASEKEAGIDLIYDRTRLLRLPNTIHSKTGFYKTQITGEELKTLTMEDIYTLAESPRGTVYIARTSASNARLRDIYMQSQLTDATRRASVLPASNTQGEEQGIRNGKVCMSRLLKGVGSGQRDEVAIRLADHFRKQGLSRELTEATLIAWNNKNDPPMSAQDISVKINSAWSNEMDYGCHDHILAANCSSTCFLYKRLVQNQNIEEPEILEKNLKTREDLVVAYVDRFFEGAGLSLGIPSLDVHLKLHGGHVLQYMAKSGSGKTAFAMHVMNNLSNKNIPSLFLSLEMSDADVAERGFQIASNTTSATLERMMLEFVKQNMSRDSMVETIIEKMGKAFDSVITVDEDSASIDSIEQYIYKAKEAFGVKVVFIDYLGRVSQTKSTSYEHISALAKELKSMAKRHDVIVFYLHQVNRSIEDATSAVDMSSGRDSGQTEEAADVVLASWRPGLEDGMDEFILRILKNRRGASNVSAHLKFEPATMQFNEITDGYESRL